MKGDDISDRLIGFAVRVIRLTRAMPSDVASKHIAGQLIRSGTGAGSNYEEGRGVESRADFVHKLSVAWKEARESLFWLKVIHRAELVRQSRISDRLADGRGGSVVRDSWRVARHGTQAGEVTDRFFILHS